MSKFKAGDRVRNIEDGDIGVTTRCGPLPDSWYVKYETGESKGEELWSWEDELELLPDNLTDLSNTEIVIAGVTYILQRK